MSCSDPLADVLPWVPKLGRQFFAAFLAVFLAYAIVRVMS